MDGLEVLKWLVQTYNDFFLFLERPVYPQFTLYFDPIPSILELTQIRSEFSGRYPKDGLEEFTKGIFGCYNDFRCEKVYVT